MKALKTGLRATTHIFTVGGILVAGAPLFRGVKAATEGQLTQAAEAIGYDTTGLSVTTGNFKPDFNKIIGTGLAIGLGIGLVVGGSYLRKRIGN